MLQATFVQQSKFVPLGKILNIILFHFHVKGIQTLIYYDDFCSFFHLETSLTIGLNEIAGFLIWHDFVSNLFRNLKSLKDNHSDHIFNLHRRLKLVVQSWVGYACVSLLFMLGSFSLGSIDDEETRGTQTTFTGPYHIEHRYSGFTNAVLLDISQMDKEMKTPLIDEDAI